MGPTGSSQTNTIKQLQRQLEAQGWTFERKSKSKGTWVKMDQYNKRFLKLLKWCQQQEQAHEQQSSEPGRT